MKEIISKYLTLSGKIEIYEVNDSEIKLNLKNDSCDIQEKEKFRDFWNGCYWNSRGRKQIAK